MAANESSVSMATAINNYVMPGFVPLWRNDYTLSILRALGMVETTGRGQYYKWHMNSSGNSSAAIFTENDPAPASVAQGYVEPYIGWNHYWAWVTITGIGRDVVDGGYFDAVTAAVQLGMADLVDYRSNILLGATNNGLQVAIDSTTAYAGITRGSAAYFESTESSTATLAGLRALHRGVRDADKGGSPRAHLVSPTVMEWYAGLAGVPASSAMSNASIRVVQSANGLPYSVDHGLALSGMGFYGAPIVEVPDLTSTVWIMLDTSFNGVKHVTIRPLQIEFHSNIGDNQLFKITAGSALVIERPARQGKMTSIS